MKIHSARVAGLVGLSALLMLLGNSGPAVSQQPSQKQINAMRQACRGDYRTYCASVPTGGKAALACLQQNAASLSPSCQQAVSAVGGGSAAQSGPVPSGSMTPKSPTPMSPREEAALMRQACGADYRTFCHGVRPGGGRAIACLRDNEASLSSGCQHALMSASQSR
jgi:hypothetical protein